MRREIGIIEGIVEVDPAPLNASTDEEDRLIVIMDHPLALAAMPITGNFQGWGEIENLFIFPAERLDASILIFIGLIFLS